MPAEEDRLNAFRESRNVRIRTRTMSRLRLIIFAETKAHYLVSGKRNIPPLSWWKDSQLYLDVPYAPLLTLPLDWQRWG